MVETIVDSLSTYGCRVQAAAEGGAGLAALDDHRFDICVLDLGLPDMDGIEFLRDLRTRSNLPVIILSGRNMEAERVLALESGADDYVNKPFSPRELLARIRAVLRRTDDCSAEPQAEKDDGAPACYAFAGWVFEPETRSLRHDDGRADKLSAGDALILEALVTRPGRVLSRDFLIEYAQGPESNSFDRSVDLHIMRIRRRLTAAAGDQGDLIETVRGAGYRFAAPVRQV